MSENVATKRGGSSDLRLRAGCTEKRVYFEFGRKFRGFDRTAANCTED